MPKQRAFVALTIALLLFAEYDRAVAFDTYNFLAQCPTCNEKRSVVCRPSKVKLGGEIEVYASKCDHSWKLSQEESDKLRKHSDVLSKNAQSS